VRPYMINRGGATKPKKSMGSLSDSQIVHPSDSMFWAKHIALGLMIIGIAAVVIFLQYQNESTPVPEGAPVKKSVASNMSKFYSEYRLSSRHPREDELGDFVLEVKESDIPLTDRLQNMESLQKPISGRWVGEYKHRTFKAGTTLRSAITDFAQSEGMQVIWELDQDFIVKHQFQMESTILGSLRTIAKAIDTNFDGTVRAFICPKQRSLVVTAKETPYLKKNCVEAR
jgi:hypothetical protein